VREQDVDARARRCKGASLDHDRSSLVEHGTRQIAAPDFTWRGRADVIAVSFYQLGIVPLLGPRCFTPAVH